jgi:hypothetical protein
MYSDSGVVFFIYGGFRGLFFKDLFCIQNGTRVSVDITSESFFFPLGLKGEVQIICFQTYLSRNGRAIAEAISRWLPTAAARVRSQVRSCGICGGQSGAGAGFLRVLRFTLPILIPPTTP